MRARWPILIIPDIHVEYEYKKTYPKPKMDKVLDILFVLVLLYLLFFALKEYILK
jgi:hypothetical protein